MSKPQNPFPNRNRQFTSITAATAFNPPIQCIQIVGAGSTVMKDEEGTTVTYTTDATTPSISVNGPFSAFTSTSATRVLLSDEQPISIPLPNTAAAAGVSVLDTADYYTSDTVEGVLAEIGQSLESAVGVIPLPPPSTWSLLADGAPMAVWANGATTVPGTYCDGAKVGGAARWNNDAAPAAIVTSFEIPPDMDITVNAVAHFCVAKTGATNNAGNTTTITSIAANQVVGALYDADTNFGGASSALLPAATAKTIQDLTLTLALADLAAYPASVTLSAKPTAGTLDTDDLVFVSARIVYQKKLQTS